MKNDGWFVYWLLGALFGVGILLCMLPKPTEFTCGYFEDKGYTIAVYEQTCMIEQDGVFVPVEELIK